MAGKAGGDDIKGSDLFKAFVDLIILALLMVGSGFGGYWYGMHERLAPVKNVAPGTPGAVPATAVTPAPAGTTQPVAAQTPATTATTDATPKPAVEEKEEKFWVTSSGTNMIGYQIVVSVNDQPVDGWFGPGKSLDITQYVKHGENSVAFNAKPLGESYNKHKNDSKAKLTLQVVKGPHITETFDKKDVLLTYTRNAAETEEYNDTLTFADGD